MTLGATFGELKGREVVERVPGRDEDRALRAGVALFDASAREVVRVTGPDRVRVTGDPVLECAGSSYLPMDDARRTALAEEFARHGRTPHLPSGAAGGDPERGTR